MDDHTPHQKPFVSDSPPSNRWRAFRHCVGISMLFVLIQGSVLVYT